MTSFFPFTVSQKNSRSRKYPTFYKISEIVIRHMIKIGLPHSLKQGSFLKQMILFHVFREVWRKLKIYICKAFTHYFKTIQHILYLSINYDISTNQSLGRCFSTKGFLATWEKKERRRRRRTLSAANLAQINQESWHIVTSCPWRGLLLLFFSFSFNRGRG